MDKPEAGLINKISCLAAALGLANSWRCDLGHTFLSRPSSNPTLRTCRCLTLQLIFSITNKQEKKLYNIGIRTDPRFRRRRRRRSKCRWRRRRGWG